MDHQIWMLRQKCQVVVLALNIAKEKTATNQNWNSCCKEAVEKCKEMGIVGATHPRTVRNWYADFRVRRKFTIHTLPDKHNLPRFLQENKDMCIKIEEYARENLRELSCEMMCEYIHETILPQMVKERTPVEKDSEEYDNELKTLLSEFGLTSVCPSTVYLWMKRLGFKYEPRRKGYYVDGHEKPATVQYRKAFVTRYLLYEGRMYRWIQITKEESLELEMKGLIPKGSGYLYTDKEGQQMVEYHVDSCAEFQ